MRTLEQHNRLRRLLQHLTVSGRDVGPISPPERTVGSFCAAGRPVWLMKTSTMDRACELAMAKDPERWGGHSVLAPWRGRRPKRRLIEREYYGLSREEVRAINRADLVPLSGDRVAGRWEWLTRLQALLCGLLEMDTPATYEVARQPVFRDEVFQLEVSAPAADRETPAHDLPARDLTSGDREDAAVAVA